ncbi:MAG: pseudouridine synthase [Candidatus Marinimicrobia bacterium]|nr:pseudouridine synthase [Candidatus Neomarinimicrobiota bacterium]
MRLNKFMSRCGVDSRRNCDELIFQKRVMVNGETVDSPAVDIDIQNDKVLVDHEKITLKKKFTYLKLNKPSGFVSTTGDPHADRIVMDLLPKVLDVVPVGRLDKNTTGVLLFTDDGDLHYRLTHPKYQLERIYDVVVSRPPVGYPENELSNGIKVDKNIFVKGKAIPLNEKRTQYKIILKEGKKREIKRIFRKYNTKVVKLHRTIFAGITADNLSFGKWQKLSTEEINYLKKITKS